MITIKERDSIIRRDSTSIDKIYAPYTKANIVTINGDNSSFTIRAGEGHWIDRTTFGKERPRNVKWAENTDFDATQGGTYTNGNFILYIDGLDNTPKIYNAGTGGLSLPFDSPPYYYKNIELCFYQLSSGLIINLSYIVSYNGNINDKMIRGIGESYASVNSLTGGVSCTYNGANIKINIVQGGIVGINQNFSQGGENSNYYPNFFSVGNDTAPVMYRGNRLGQIIGQSSDINVTQYESSPGVFTPLDANKAMNVFVLVFPTLVYQTIYTAVIQGNQQYATLLSAYNSTERLDRKLPFISSGVQISRISLFKAAAPDIDDLSDPAQASFKEVDQFQ